MADIFELSSIIGGRAKSPLASYAIVGEYPAADGAIGVTLSERFGLAICEVAAWPEHVETVRTFIPNETTAFEYAPARWLLIDEDQKLPKNLANKIDDLGSAIELSHGRTVVRLRGKDCEWVLSKLFAIDFEAMAEKSGLATSHHGIGTQIWRDDKEVFDLIVFRSFAASFWHTLTKSCADVGYAIK